MLIVNRLLLGCCCCLVLTTSSRCQEAHDAIVGRAMALADAGDFRSAEQLLRNGITAVEAPVTEPRARQLEILRRIRLDFSLTTAMLLDKIRPSIPDVTRGDIDRWRAEGVLQYRTIDGELRYFESEPRNLFRFSHDAQQRRIDTRTPPRTNWKFDLPKHLAQIVRRAGDGNDALLLPVKHRVTYRLTVKKTAPHLRRGAKIRCWLPYPQNYRQQTSVRLLAAKPEHYRIAPNAYPQRTICFEQTVGDPDSPPTVEVQYEFVTSAYYPKLAPTRVRPYDEASDLFQTYTAQRPPHIVFTPEIRDIVKQVAANEPNPLQRARKLFHWMDANVRYCSEMEYSTLPNISAKALATRRGDCGVQSLLFITLCRAAGIPARWQSGWETKPNGRNMHDWAEFYVAPWGWLPADPSYGLQKHNDPRVREFYCGHLDPYRMIVNLDFGRALTPAKTSFRSEPNDFQRGEIEIDGHNLYFDQWTWSCTVDTTPLTRDFLAVEESLDNRLPPQLLAGHVPGAVVLVGMRTGTGYATWQKAYGYRQLLPTPEPMTVDTIFDMASMTKPIATGTSLMVLADQGRVDVADPAAKYLPEFDTPEKRQVTIRHLMTHMSGECPYVGAPDQRKIIDRVGFPCPTEARSFIRQLDLVRRPGAAMQYSCLNAILCAEIIRRITGRELNAFAADNVFAPLGMNDTGFLPPPCRDPRLAPTEKAYFGRGAGQFRRGQVHDPLASMQGGVSGNAGLFSTAADLSRYAQMMLNGGVLDDIHILKSDTIAAMTHIQNPGGVNTQGKPDRRGLLWDIYPPDAGDRGIDQVYAFGHTGYTGTAMRCYPSRGLYIIVLTNRVHPDDRAKVSGVRTTVWRTVGEALLGLTP